MSKKNIILIFLFLQGCARWEPVIDPRGSKDPEEVTRDILECRELTKNIEPSVFKCKENIFKQELCERPMRKCLINRGHQSKLYILYYHFLIHINYFS